MSFESTPGCRYRSILIGDLAAGEEDMTEYELSELVLHSIDIYTSTLEMLYVLITIYVTFLFAYLAAAFVAGARLTLSQSIIGSTLFVTASGGVVFQVAMTLGGLQGTTRGTSRFISRLAEESKAGAWMHNEAKRWLTHGAEIESASYLIVGVLLFGILASLYFMWSVRHPRTG
jgi:hypothetical protein